MRDWHRSCIHPKHSKHCTLVWLTSTLRKGIRVDIKLGSRVYSTNGRHVGNVDSLVVDYNTKDVTSIIVRSGVFLATDRIFPVETFDSIDDDGAVHLNLNDEEAENEQEFVKRDYVAWDPNNSMYPYTDEAWVSGTGQPSVFWAYGTAPLGYSGSAPFFAEAPTDAPVEEVETNLPEQSVLVNKGTDVVGKDGEKIGTVDEVLYDSQGEIDGFVVRAGFLFHHDVHIPGDLIDEVSGEVVTLNVTSDQAEQYNHAG